MGAAEKKPAEGAGSAAAIDLPCGIPQDVRSAYDEAMEKMKGLQPLEQDVETAAKRLLAAVGRLEALFEAPSESPKNSPDSRASSDHAI